MLSIDELDLITYEKYRKSPKSMGYKVKESHYES
jgi:hypothetical protein